MFRSDGPVHARACGENAWASRCRANGSDQSAELRADVHDRFVPAVPQVLEVQSPPIMRTAEREVPRLAALTDLRNARFAELNDFGGQRGNPPARRYPMHEAPARHPATDARGKQHPLARKDAA